MTTHFYKDCPRMAEGDEILDTEGLGLDDWVYDCETCQYAERVWDKAWAGGLRNGLQAALYRLDDVHAAINVGHSKLEVFRLLIKEFEDIELVHSPGYLPFLIMTIEEISAYQCPACSVRTSYSRTEDNVDVWLCDEKIAKLALARNSGGSRAFMLRKSS